MVDLRRTRRADAGPAFLRRPTGWLYGAGARLFHTLHDHGILRARRVRTPVISVGALTVGGSGKTPFARWLAGGLAANGFAPAVLSRGYRSGGGSAPRVVSTRTPDAARDGDEPALLARSLPGIPVVVCPDRARAASVAAGHGADVMILDDGFQHRRLYRDVDIVLWDRTAERSAGRTIPAGSLREPERGLRRADLLVLVDRGDGLPSAPAGAPPGERIFDARLVPCARQHVEPGSAVHALSGLADPASFEAALRVLGLRVTGATRHPDHHAFVAAEIQAAARRAADEGADFLAVTAKDHARWPSDRTGALPVPAVFDLDVEMESEDALLKMVTGLLAGAER